MNIKKFFINIGLACDHDWVEIGRTYANPIPNYDGAFIDVNLVKKLAFGVTSILWECSKCSKLRKEELLGKQLKESES